MTQRLAIGVMWALATILCAAGVQKLRDVEGFAHDLFQFGVLHWRGAVSVASFIPWLEIFVAAGFAIPRIRRGAVLLAVGLSAGFSLSHGIAWWRVLEFSCGCFGNGDGAVHPAISLAGTLLMCGAATFAYRELIRRGE